MTNRPLQLKALGQSVWYDTIDRVHQLSGLFDRVIFLLREVFDDDYPQIAKCSKRRLHLSAVPMTTPACHEAGVALLFTPILPLRVG